MSKKRCSQCKQYFDSMADDSINTPVMFFCSIEHQLEYAYASNNKLRKSSIAKQKKADKTKLKEVRRDRKWWTQKVQKKCNEYVRLKHSKEPCISCGATNYTLTAGHYRSAGASPELRFNTKNIKQQCWWNCNKNLSGNLINYRIQLIKQYGQSYVDYLEGHHEPKHYSIEQLERLYRWFNYRCKQLKKRINK